MIVFHWQVRDFRSRKCESRLRLEMPRSSRRIFAVEKQKSENCGLTRPGRAKRLCGSLPYWVFIALSKMATPPRRDAHFRKNGPQTRARDSSVSTKTTAPEPQTRARAQFPIQHLSSRLHDDVVPTSLPHLEGHEHSIRMPLSAHARCCRDAFWSPSKLPF